jgi:hypothetical protein
MKEDDLIRKVTALLSCDTARVMRFPRKLFLVIGHNRHSEGTWFRCEGTRIALEPGAVPPDGFEPVNFDYLEEHAIANGASMVSLWRQARHYAKLKNLTGIDALIEELRFRGCSRKRLTEIRKISKKWKMGPAQEAAERTKLLQNQHSQQEPRSVYIEK